MATLDGPTGVEGIRGAAAVWSFARPYLEMVTAMLAGMLALAALSAGLLDLPDRTSVKILEMAAWMTAPMVAWMRIRGHSWRACGEMAAAMLFPAVGALVVLTIGAVSDSHLLLMVEHIVMFPAMLVVMLLRRDEYVGHRRHATSPVGADHHP